MTDVVADNPFVGDELLERRAQHRRRLRLVDPWILTAIAQSAVTPNGEVRGSDRTMLECMVRDLADEEADHLADLLQQMEDHEAAELIVPYLRSTWRPGESLRPDSLRPDVTALISHYEEQQERTKINEMPDEPQRSHLVRYVAFLLWADELAGDAYRDPRLSTT